MEACPAPSWLLPRALRGLTSLQLTSPPLALSFLLRYEDQTSSLLPAADGFSAQ